MGGLLHILETCGSFVKLKNLLHQIDGCLLQHFDWNDFLNNHFVGLFLSFRTFWQCNFSKLSKTVLANMYWLIYVEHLTLIMVVALYYTIWNIDFKKLWYAPQAPWLAPWASIRNNTVCYTKLNIGLHKAHVLNSLIYMEFYLPYDQCCGCALCYYLYLTDF